MMGCSELTLLKRAWTLLSHIEAVSNSSFELTTDIQKYLDKQAESESDTSPCCHAPVIRYRSFNKKVCADCNQEFEWPLKPGQEPLIKATR